MKNTKINLAILISLLGLTQLLAQKTNTWKGGFPGQETAWECGRNWTLGIAPDWNTHAVIPWLARSVKYYPRIQSTDAEAFSVVIEPGAQLEVAPDAELMITGVNAYDLPVFNGGTFRVRGVLKTSETAGAGPVALSR